MRWSRSRFLLSIACGLTLCAIVTVPRKAYASLIDMGDTPYLAVYDKSYDTGANLDNNDAAFTSWIRSNVRPVVGVSSYSAGYFMPTNIEYQSQGYDTFSYGVSSGTVSTLQVSDYWLSTQYSVPSMSGWSTYPIGALLWTRDNEPLASGTCLRLESSSGVIQMYSGGSDSYTRYTIDMVNVWCSNSTAINTIRHCSYDPNKGCWVTPITARYFFVTFRIRGNVSGTNNVFHFPTSWKLYQDLEGTYTQQIISNNNQQTETLMNTDGSSDIVSGMSGQGQQVANRLGFVSQTAGFVTSTVDAIGGGSAQDGVTFPGISWDGNVIVAQQSVNILGWLGTDVETAVKSFCTMLVFLAWISGLRGLYHKIFLGEVEVELVDE